VLSSASVTLSTHADRDRRRPIPPADLAAASPIDVSFATRVVPILERRCVSCHASAAPAGALSLDVSSGLAREVFDALVTYVDAGRRARRSPLVERVLGEELEAEGTPTGRCPPEGLSEAEVRDLARWIEAGASFEEVPHAP
jgi:hypothetical protein